MKLPRKSILVTVVLKVATLALNNLSNSSRVSLRRSTTSLRFRIIHNMLCRSRWQGLLIRRQRAAHSYRTRSARRFAKTPILMKILRTITTRGKAPASALIIRSRSKLAIEPQKRMSLTRLSRTLIGKTKRRWIPAETILVMPLRLSCANMQASRRFTKNWV